jgi:hypothetical protein
VYGNPSSVSVRPTKLVSVPKCVDQNRCASKTRRGSAPVRPHRARTACRPPAERRAHEGIRR